VNSDKARDRQVDGQRDRPCDVGRLSLATLGARILLEQWQRALACEPGVRHGDDPEDVHKMRVALRRFRAALQVFGKTIDRAADAPVGGQLADDASVVARALGKVRDLDVSVAWLREEAQTLPPEAQDAIQHLVERQLAERAAAKEAAVEALDSVVTGRLRSGVEARLVPVAEPAASDRVHRAKRQAVSVRAPALVAKRLRRLRRLEESLIVPGSSEIHRARIGAKKLRYTAEFFTPVFPAALPPLIDLATQIQDTLGEVHDFDVFADALLAEIERVAQEPAQAVQVAGIAQVIRRLHERRETAAAQFRPLWAALPKPRTLRRQLKRDGTSRRRESGHHKSGGQQP
jgi:CHAD domain-containing protein